MLDDWWWVGWNDYWFWYYFESYGMRNNIFVGMGLCYFLCFVYESSFFNIYLLEVLIIIEFDLEVWVVLMWSINLVRFKICGLSVGVCNWVVYNGNLVLCKYVFWLYLWLFVFVDDYLVVLFICLMILVLCFFLNFIKWNFI